MTSSGVCRDLLSLTKVLKFQKFMSAPLNMNLQSFEIPVENGEESKRRYVVVDSKHCHTH